MEKSVDYYMNLPYTVEIKPDGRRYQASVKELPGCKATVEASENMEELWRRLKEDQRKRIEELLEFGDEVPVPPGANVDPLREDFPDGLDVEEVRTLLYRDGATVFPLPVLVELWLDVLQEGRSAKAEGLSVLPKGGVRHLDQTIRALGDDLHPVRLGKSLKAAWVEFEGPRTKHGYSDIEILDQPLRTEAALVAALTVLEASPIADFDFKRLRQALLEHVEARPELKDKDVREVLNRLPARWFSSQKVRIDAEIRQLTPEERKKEENKVRLPKRWRRWERDPLLWRRSIKYALTLLRYHRPDFDGYPLEQQLDMLDQHRKRMNEFLDKQRMHTAFLEYGTRKGLPKAVESARDQVKAAVLADVKGMQHLGIADELGLDVSREEYEVNMRISQVSDLVRDGRLLLDRVLGEGGWRKKSEEMKAEAERYRSLTKEDKDAEALAHKMGWTTEYARSLYKTNPGLAEFLAMPL